MSRLTVLEIKASLSNLPKKTVRIQELLFIVYPFAPLLVSYHVWLRWAMALVECLVDHNLSLYTHEICTVN